MGLDDMVQLECSSDQGLFEVFVFKGMSATMEEPANSSPDMLPQNEE